MTEAWRPIPSRFIPACAGNRWPWRSSATAYAVHPRVCGEQIPRREKERDLFGSSPRVRGTVREVRAGSGLRRFIPACAGNSCRDGTTGQCLPVHPRVCGEQSGYHVWRGWSGGSSPRVRGTGFSICEGSGAQRFIPACAGNSGFGGGAHLRAPVHPRVCGEQRWTPLRSPIPTGSSPRVRGTG